MAKASNNLLPLGVTIKCATPDDAGIFVEIHEEAARWLWDRGIHQWQPGELPRAWVDGTIVRGELYIVRRDGEAIGTVMLEWSDEETWGARPDDAGYIHGLRIRRSAAGQGLGRALLAWAEGKIVQAGRPFARLDCAAANTALCAYYERAGYMRLDDLIEGDYRAARFEKRLVGVDMTEQQWTLETPRGALVIRQAQPEDVPTLVTMDETTAQWVRSLGIEPGNAPRPISELFAEAVARGEMYLALRDGVAAGKITLQTGDDHAWEGILGDALYVHGLATVRAFAGQEIGQTLLRWAEERAREYGKPYLRLDCNADNPALRAYYERAGFIHRGDVQMPHREASRYEKQIGEAR